MRQLQEIASQLERFEAGESIPNTGTGARREGDSFERLAVTWWDAIADYLSSRGAQRGTVRADGTCFARLQAARRTLYLPCQTDVCATPADAPAEWFRRSFGVREMVAHFPTEEEAIKRYAPTKGPFAGSQYPQMYSRMKTHFDATIVFEEDGVLLHKILLEYKTAKSSRGDRIDGNAHERLSYQIMQYLEVATRYTRCSLIVLANGAFAFYRNKYHVGFHIQADRLACFAWFRMRYVCTSPEYLALAEEMASLLFPSTSP